MNGVPDTSEKINTPKNSVNKHISQMRIDQKAQNSAPQNIVSKKSFMLIAMNNEGRVASAIG